MKSKDKNITNPSSDSSGFVEEGPVYVGPEGSESPADPKAKEGKMDAAKRKAKESGEKIKQQASRAGDKVEDFYDTAKEQVVEKTSQATARAGAEIRHASDATVSAFERNPLAFAAGAFALGLVAGYLIPNTRVESRSMRDLSRDARRKASDLAETGKQAFADAADATRQGLEDEGLTKDDLKAKAGRVQSDAEDAFKSSIKDS